MKLTIAGLLLASACATAPVASTAPTTACGADSSAVANRGAAVYVQPDGTSETVARLKADTRVCVGGETAGFGFRHVKLTDGREGYIEEASLSL